MAQSWPASVPRDVCRIACAAVCAGQALVALVLVGRSLSGALTREFSPLAACVVATATVALGLGAYLLARLTWAESLRERWLVIAAAFVPPLLVAMIVVPAGSVGAIAYATVLVVLCAGAVWLVEEERRGEFLPSAAEAELSPPRCRPGGDAVQWMSRSETEGGETVEGGVRVAFAPGQRQEVLHVSFCPPLAGVPEVECEVLDEALVDVRVTAAQPYGLRIEARRDEAREALTTEIGFVAAAVSIPGDAGGRSHHGYAA